MRALLITADGAFKIAELPDNKPAIWRVDIQLTVDPQRLIDDPDVQTNLVRKYEYIGDLPMYREGA